MMTTLAICTALVLAAQADDRQCVMIVVGARGADQYREQFDAWARRWTEAAERSQASLIEVGRGAEQDLCDKEQLRQHVEMAPKASWQTLWIVLIGHGTFDGRSAKFNLRGPDLSAEELAQWLSAWQRPLAIINCASSSAPFINRLSGPNRVVVTATKSGYEVNYARFGDYLSQAIADPSADLDKDEQTSLLEAYLAADAAVAEFYSQQARLATEHALVDDNGDALGTPASWFRGVRAIRTPKDGATPDGTLANQFHLIRSGQERGMTATMRASRDALERQVANLRESKGALSEEEYYERLEVLLISLARLYENVEGAAAAGQGTPEPAQPLDPDTARSDERAG
jgi:hypothetical protein